MAISIPTPRSFSQILNDNINGFLSRSGLPAVKIGSPLLSIFEAISQSQLKNSGEIFALLQAVTLNFAQGLAVDRIGADEEVFRIGQSPANGLVNFFDTSFTKISSNISQSTPAPIVGSVLINVVDGSLFPVTGSIYLGRNSNNYEGPIAYTSIVNNGNYWTFTLTTGTLRFHNVGEEVVLSQGGDRLIPSFTVVQTPQGNLNNAVQFQTLFSATIPDGETELDSIAVSALIPGVTGNVLANNITQFASIPFTGAAVTNPLPFTNGLAIEDDDNYKERIRNVRQSRTQGTDLAITTAAIGIVSPDENKRVVSASLVEQQGQPSVLYIDDGTGYEEISDGVAIETLVDSAFGGEQYFKISNPRPVTKAYLASTQVAPFVLASGQKLAFSVGEVVTEHTFDTTDFFSINNATSYEVVSSINGDPNILWSARTYNNATQVAVFAKADTNESIQNVAVTDGIDANPAFEFSSFRTDTMRLYKNDVLLNKDGEPAKAFSNSIVFWSNLTGSQSLIIEIDGIILNFDGVSLPKFSNQDFINAKTGYNAVGANSIQAWAAVFNLRIPGITATIQSGLIVLTSNRGNSSLAQVSIIGGDLVNNHMFQVQNSIGANNDYTLNRNTGELALAIPLVPGDKLAIGTISTRAFIQTPSIISLNILSDANLWFDVDGNAIIIPTGLTAFTALTVNVLSGERWGKILQFLNISIPLWANVQVGDWAIFYDPAFTNLKGAFRISSVTPNSFTIESPDMNVSRWAHQLTNLTGGFNGQVLATGGYTQGMSGITSTAEVYNSNTYAWVPTTSMANARAWHGSSILPSGKVLVVGGLNTTGAINSCEIWDPTTGLWAAAANLPIAVYQHTTTTLNTGDVLVTGGRTGASTFTANTYTYNEGSNTWTAVGVLSTPRALHTATILEPSGNVIVACGENTLGPSNTSDLYTGVWGPPVAGNPSVGAHSRAAANINGVAYVTGGSLVSSSSPDSVVNNVDVYTDGVGWSIGSTLNNARCKHIIVATPDGHLTVSMGSFGMFPIPSIITEVFSGGWTVTSNPISVMVNGSGPAVDTRIYARAVNLAPTNPLNGVDAVLINGGLTSDLSNVSSVTDIYKENVDTWYIPDVSIPNPFSPPVLNLLNTGLIIVRTPFLLENVVIPTDNNYTPFTLAEALNGTYISTTLEPSIGLNGAQASVYKTTQVRVNTNSYKITPDYLGDKITIGDIALVAADIQGQKLQLPISNAVDNSFGQLANVESFNSEVGTPDFHQTFVVGSTSNTNELVLWSPDPNALVTQPDSSYSIVGALDLPDGTTGRYNSNLGFYSFLSSIISEGTIDLLNLRKKIIYPLIPGDRGYFASPYAIGSDDTFTTLIDGDTTSKRYTLNMWRTVKPTTSTYAQTNFFTDVDNGNQSLAVGFGLNFSFNDFAVFMAARAQTDPLDPTKTVLWRYFRLGPDGDYATVQYGLPIGPNLPVGFTVNNNNNQFNNITINIASGTLKTGYPFTSQTNIAEVAPVILAGLTTVYYILGFPILTGTRTAGVTTIQIQMPAGVNHSGLQVGGLYNFVSNNFIIPSNNITILSINQTIVGPGNPYDSITYNDGTPGNAGPVANPGVLYLGFQQVSNLTGATPAIVQGDFFRLNPGASTDPNYQNITIRIASDPTVNPYWIQGVIENFTGTVSDTAIIYPIGSASAFQIFANPAQTVSMIVNAIKALNLSNSQLPVSPTLIGSGTGIIDRSSAEFAGSSPAYVQLTDGINYVQTTTPPGTVLGNYQLSFKNTINSNLATNSDWANEVIRLVPRTNKNIIDWFNAPTVSGLFSSAEVVNSSQGQRVQIASLTPGSAGSVVVQGGTANLATAPVVGSSIVIGNYLLATVPKANIGGFYGNQWVSIDNTLKLPKAVIDASTILNSITLSNNQAFFTLDPSGTPIWTHSDSVSNSALVIIEPQGKFIAITSASQTHPMTIATAKEGDWIRITLPATPLFPSIPINGSNTGIFRVVRTVNTGTLNGEGATVWIENISGTLQTIAECDIQFYTFDSMMPGDTLFVSTPLWGQNTLGSWTITSVGDTGTGVQFNSRFIFTVNATQTVPTLISSTVGPLGAANNGLIQVIEAKPSRMIKQILSIAPNQSNANYFDVKFTSYPGISRVNASGESIITALDKLNFPFTLSTGVDGYKHSVGLIGATNRVLYGDPSDPLTYPGVVAASSVINISGPLVKRIQVAMSLRIQSGLTLNDLKEQVQNAIATIINNTGVGEPIALSALTTAAMGITGVVSAVMINPSSSNGQDLIPVLPNEKPLVLNISQDVSISFVGV